MDLLQIMEDKLWEKCSEGLLKRRRDLQSTVEGLEEGSSWLDQRVALGTSCCVNAATDLLQSARAIWLMTKKKNGEQRKREIHQQLGDRIRSNHNDIINICVLGLSKKSAIYVKGNITQKTGPTITRLLAELLGLPDPLEGRQAMPMASSSSLSFNPRVKILFMAADPVKFPEALNLDEEFREIQRSIQGSKLRDQIDLEACLAATPQDFLNALNVHRPKIVHFCGHGSNGSGILLQGELQDEVPVGDEFLADIFSTLSSDIQLVVLNACYSQYQAEAISRSISVTIGTEYQIADEVSIAFSRAFYSALGNGMSVGKSFSQASAVLVNVLREQPPVILCRNSIEPNSLILTRTADTESYESLALSLNRHSREFFRRDQKLARFLDEAGPYLGLYAACPDSMSKGFDSSQIPTEKLSQLDELIGSIFNEEQERARSYFEHLKEITSRWGRFFTDSAIGKITRLEQAVSDHREVWGSQMSAIVSCTPKLFQKDGGGAASSGDLLSAIVSFVSCLKQVHQYLDTAHRSIGLHYNQLLEFLPGDLLLKGRVHPVNISPILSSPDSPDAAKMASSSFEIQDGT